MKDYILDCMDKYPAVFKEKIDVLCHLFATNGNGVDLFILGESRVDSNGYKIGGRMFTPFEADPVAMRSIYPWSNNKLFLQPFRKMDPDQMHESDAEGIRSYARYFVDCLELTTEEDVLADRVEALTDWKANIQVFKDFYGID